MGKTQPDSPVGTEECGAGQRQSPPDAIGKTQRCGKPARHGREDSGQPQRPPGAVGKAQHCDLTHMLRVLTGQERLKLKTR